MPNLSQIKRQRMLDFLETLRKEHTDDESIRAYPLRLYARVLPLH